MSDTPEAPRAVWFWNYDCKTEKMRAIILTEEKSHEESHSEDTDEGHSYWGESYTYEDGIVYFQGVSGGTDCDGAIRHDREMYCHFSKLNAVYNDYNKKFQPDWTEGKHEVYDQFAQMAGY